MYSLNKGNALPDEELYTGKAYLFDGSNPLSIFVEGWKRILEQISMRPQHAVEVCCGTLPKIGIALDHELKSQNVWYIDKSESALVSCVDIAFQNSRHANINSINMYLSDTNTIAADIVAGNHALDDLIIMHYLRERGLEYVDPYKNEIIFRKITDIIINTCHKPDNELVYNIFNDIDKWVARGGVVLLSDYRSWHEKEYNMWNWFE